MVSPNADVRVWPWAVVTGLAAGALSLFRLWLGNSQAVTENLWAEDGLFALCIHKANFETCLVDPFAGYMLFLPRVLAWPVSVLPWESWALAANVLAAVLAGLTAAFVLVIMRGAGLSWFVSSVTALLPVISPMVGLEALNAIGSSYMLLLFASTLAALFRPNRGRGWTGLIGALLLVTALTIPSAVVLVLLVAIQWVRRQIDRSVALIWLGALAVGLGSQMLVVFTATSRRPLNLSDQSLSAWADSVPISLLTYWPGISLGEYSFFTNFALSPLNWTGWLVVAAIVVLAAQLIIRGWRSSTGNICAIGLLISSGLAFGLIPSAIGYANNRYFVVPLLLWGAALLVWLDPRIRAARPWTVGLVSVVIVIIWSPAIPASEYRSTPAPRWSDEVARIEAKCLSDPAFVDRPLFTPFWPPNWGDGLDEPTHPNLPCTTVFRWIP